MWHCEVCGAEGEDHFEVCWGCGTPRGGYVEAEEADEADEAAGRAPAAADAPYNASSTPPDSSSRTCLACGAELEYRGEKRLLLGSPGDQASPLAWLDHERTVRLVEYWACPGCRRLELYEAQGD